MRSSQILGFYLPKREQHLEKMVAIFDSPPKMTDWSFWRWNHLRRSGRNSALVAIPSRRGLVPWQYVDIYIYYTDWMKYFLYVVPYLLEMCLLNWGTTKSVFWCIFKGKFVIYSVLLIAKTLRVELWFLIEVRNQFGKSLTGCPKFQKHKNSCGIWLVNWPLTLCWLFTGHVDS